MCAANRPSAITGRTVASGLAALAAPGVSVCRSLRVPPFHRTRNAAFAAHENHENGDWGVRVGRTRSVASATLNVQPSMLNPFRVPYSAFFVSRRVFVSRREAVIRRMAGAGTSGGGRVLQPKRCRHPPCGLAAQPIAGLSWSRVAHPKKPFPQKSWKSQNLSR